MPVGRSIAPEGDKLKGWAVDLKAVYGKYWKDKAKFYLSEDLWESPDGGVAALLYSIAEIGISKEIGRLAIVRNKERPEVIFNLSWLECWYLYDSTVQFGGNGVMFAHRFRPGKTTLGIVPCVLDPGAKQFAAIDRIPGNFYQIRELEGTKYGFKKMADKNPSEIAVDLNVLSWQPMRDNMGFWKFWA